MAAGCFQDHADAEIASDTTDLLQATALDKHRQCNWTRTVTVGTLMIAGCFLLATCNALPQHRPQTLQRHPFGLIAKSDAALRWLLVTNVKKFRQTMESSEIAESLRLDEGHNVNPVRSAEVIGFTESEIQSLHEAFDEWDANRDGYISKLELKKKMEGELHMKGVEDVDIERMIQEGDAHGDTNGKISFKEFASLMQRAHEQSVDVEKAVFQFFDMNKDNQVEVFEAWKRQKEMQEGGDTEDQMQNSDVGQVIQSVDMSHDGRDSMAEWSLMAE